MCKIRNTQTMSVSKEASNHILNLRKSMNNSLGTRIVSTEFNSTDEGMFGGWGHQSWFSLRSNFMTFKTNKVAQHNQNKSSDYKKTKSHDLIKRNHKTRDWQKYTRSNHVTSMTFFIFVCFPFKIDTKKVYRKIENNKNLNENF